MTAAEADKIEAMTKAVNNLTIAFREHAAKEEACREHVHDLRLHVFGNGKAGLITDVDRLKQLVKYALATAPLVGAALGVFADRLVLKWFG